MEKSVENILWANDLMEKFSCLPYFPQRQRGVDALVECFLAMVPDRTIGDKLVARLLRDCEQSPTPAKMREVLEYEVGCPAADNPPSIFDNPPPSGD